MHVHEYLILSYDRYYIDTELQILEQSIVFLEVLVSHIIQ